MYIKLLNENAKMPTRGSKNAAGWDIYSANPETIEIAPGGMVKIPTGFATEFPSGLFAGVFPRSGIATKQGLRLANCVAVIDADYRGEWLVPLYNDSDEVQIIEPGTRIAQFIMIPYSNVIMLQVENLSDTERGEGGFGSSGTK